MAKMEVDKVKAADRKDEVARAKKALEGWAEIYPICKEVDFDLFAEKAPYIIDLLYDEPFIERISVERRTIDPLTRELIFLGILFTHNATPGIVVHVEGALNAGATVEQIMEVLFWSSYAAGKVNGVMNLEGIKMALEKTGKLKPKDDKASCKEAAC